MLKKILNNEEFLKEKTTFNLIFLIIDSENDQVLEYSELIVFALPSKIICDVTKKINKILKQKKSKKIFLNMIK